MNAVLKAVHFVALCLLVGGPVFWAVLWRLPDSPEVAPLTGRVWQRVRLGTRLGALGFVLSGYADLLRAASQVIDPVHLDDLWQFLVHTRYGHMTLLKSALTPLFLLSFVVLPRHSPRLAHVCVALCGLGLLSTLSLTSHAAARPGIVPVLVDTIHLVGAVIWVGGLVYVALLPWPILRQNSALVRHLLWTLVERFSHTALIAVLLLTASGAVMAFFHVYGLTALTDTPYGRTLSKKVALVLLALGVAGWQLMVLSPQLRRQARTFVPALAHTLVARCALLVRMETLLLISALSLAALLTTLPPAERPARVVHGLWEKRLGAWHLRLTMIPQNDRGHVQFDAVLDHLHGPEALRDTQLLVHLRMQDHDMGTVRQVATPVAVGHYTAPGLISMAGTWEVEVTIVPPRDAPLLATFGFEAATGLLEQDRSRRLELAAVSASPLNALSCFIGLLLTALALLTMWASRRRRLPLWATPFGLLLMAGGGYLVLRVVLVDAYPTTYRRNPLPYAAATVATGETLFRTHCTVCHGLDGRGDGPAAAGLNPRPADLTAPHVDDHTDGDLFWWLTYGMAGTAMPAWETQLSESERWMIIHYIRSLRRGRP